MVGLTKPKWSSISFRGVLGAFGGTAKVIWYIVLVVTIVAFWYDFWLWNFNPGDDSPLNGDISFEDYDYEGCDAALIQLHGDLYTYAVANTDPENTTSGDVASSEEIAYQIQMADLEPDVKAIILEIDSYGGSPVAAEEVAKALKNADKPTVAQIRETGLSAGYYAATGADIIFASELSSVGGIGVTQSYVDASGYNQKEGYTYNSLSIGKYKDMFDPEKPLTADERALAMRDLQISHEIFVKAVAENRMMDISKVRLLADGSSILGKMALENGLIDRIGGYSEVEGYLTEMMGYEPVVCW